MVIHQIFTGGRFNYDSYLSAISAINTHAHDAYYLWYSVRPEEDVYFKLIEEFSEISDKVFVNKLKYDFHPEILSYKDFRTLSIYQDKDDPFCMANLKDIFMWEILYKYGGLFLDLDTLSIKDISGLYAQIKSVGFFGRLPSSDAKISGYNAAVVMAVSESPYIKEIIEDVKGILDNPPDDFQWDSVGPNQINRLVAKHQELKTAEGIMSFPMLIADGHEDGKIERWFDDDGYVWDQCHILHTYRSCGYSKPFCDSMNETWIYKSKSPYASFVKRTLPVESWNPYNVPQPSNTIRRQKVFHLLGLAHIPTSKEASLSCAYSQKVLKLGTMLKSLGHKVFFYGTEGSNVECDEFIQCSTKNILERSFGKRTDVNKFYDLSSDNEATWYFDKTAIQEINYRKSPTDFLLCMYGLGHKKIADAVKLPLTIEPGIGYKDTFSNYRIFESYNWMSYVTGWGQKIDGSNYDYVIPNYFDPNDFEYSDKKGDYYLYLGRLAKRKGIEIAIQVVNAIGGKLLVSGQDIGENGLIPSIHSDCVEYVGYSDVEQRKRLLSEAKALFVPTEYVPPFEGVHIEAAFSGTPVITSDFGCFGETVIPGITGFRCKTFDDYIFAALNIDKINPIDCYNYAMNNYSMDRLKWRYEEYFESVLDVYTNKAWYQRHLDRTSIDCLTRSYSKSQSKPEPLNAKDDGELSAWSSYSMHECERDKQTYSAKLMGLDFSNYVLDLGGKSVLEVGAGPIGLTLRCVNGRRKVIDPLPYPDWVWERYKYFGVEVEHLSAEDMNEGDWDEVWVLNVLQHVNDVGLAMEKIKKSAKVLRIFDWLNVPSDTCHPNILTKEILDLGFGINGQTTPIKCKYMYDADAYCGVYPLEKR